MKPRVQRGTVKNINRGGVCLSACPFSGKQNVTQPNPEFGSKQIAPSPTSHQEQKGFKWSENKAIEE